LQVDARIAFWQPERAPARIKQRVEQLLESKNIQEHGFHLIVGLWRLERKRTRCSASNSSTPHTMQAGMAIHRINADL
jgi:hypothetical protein